MRKSINNYEKEVNRKKKFPPGVFFSLISLFFIFQEYVSIFFVNILDPSKVNTIFFHAIILMIIIAYSLYCKIHFSKIIIPIFIVIIYSIISLYFLGGSVVSVSSYLRNFLSFTLMAYSIIYFCRNNFIMERRVAINFIYFVLLLSMFLLFVQYLYGVDKYILFIGIDKFYYSRGISDLGDIPIGFYSINPVTGDWYYRYPGIFVSPEKLSYIFLVFFSYYGFVILRKGKIIFFFFYYIFSFIILAIFSIKIVMMFYVLFFFGLILKNHGFIFRILVSVGLSSFLIFSYYVKDPDEFYSSGAAQHLYGLFKPLSNYSLGDIEFYIGNGIGSGGTVGRVNVHEDSNQKHKEGGESFIGSTFYQFGVIGVSILFYMFIFLDKKSSLFLDKKSYLGVSSVLSSLFVCYMFSESVSSLFQSVCFVILILLISIPNKNNLNISRKL